MIEPTTETNLRPSMGPPVMGFQDPPDFDGRVGPPWVVISLFVLLAMAVAFAGGTGFGYSMGRGKAASAGVAPGRSDAELASETASMVQTLRSQIELYRLQHLDKYPTLAQLQDNWSVLMRTTNAKGSFVIGGHAPTYGPYMQAPPVNPLNGKTNVCGLGAPTADAGWGYNPAKGEIKAIAPPGTAGDSMPDSIVAHAR
jgi:hypothetical protein